MTDGSLREPFGLKGGLKGSLKGKLNDCLGFVKIHSSSSNALDPTAIKLPILDWSGAGRGLLPGRNLTLNA